MVRHLRLAVARDGLRLGEPHDREGRVAEDSGGHLVRVRAGVRVRVRARVRVRVRVRVRARVGVWIWVWGESEAVVTMS